MHIKLSHFWSVGPVFILSLKQILSIWESDKTEELLNIWQLQNRSAN